MDNKSKGNKMGEMPIPKLLISMSLPAIVGMLVQALYNFVDSIFVSRISEDALTALSLAFPIQMIIIAGFVGLGVGITAVISRKLGEKDSFAATIAAEHGYLLCAIYIHSTARNICSTRVLREFHRQSNNNKIWN